MNKSTSLLLVVMMIALSASHKKAMNHHFQWTLLSLL
jgi:hypothetical protein